MKPNLFKFINSAISDDETRYAMCQAYYDEPLRRLVATNGHALHYTDLTQSQAEAFGLKESGYHVLDNKSGFALPHPLQAQFPNYTKVIPEYAPDDNSPSVKMDDPAHWCSVFCAHTRVAISYEYFKELEKGATEWRYALDPVNPQTKAVHFISKADTSIHAVIMPISWPALVQEGVLK
jgi:hypothetical protein